jgi:septal ring factor EnvC (AmiA/AmiB activator)
VLTNEDRQWITEQLQGLRTEMAELRAEMQENLERVETTLLSEFHKWASPLEMRIRTHAATLRALDAEMESHADRLKKLEDR